MLNILKSIIFFFIDNLVEQEAKKRQAKVIERDFKQLQRRYDPRRDAAPDSSPTGKDFVGNAVRNISWNAYDNTIGYVLAKGQNRRTERSVRKDPSTRSRVAYLQSGVMQNEGGQYRRARMLRKEGELPFITRGHHNLPRKEGAEKTLEQISDFQKRTGLKDPHTRNDYFMGHSSGGDVGIYMAGDKRTKNLGIKKVYAVAPAPAGVYKARTIGQRLVLPIASKDNTTTLEGRAHAVELDKRKPQVPVYVIAGKYDKLVTPKDAAYRHATKHYVIDHKDSTHFGTSGGNKTMNQTIHSIEQGHYKAEERKQSSNVVKFPGEKPEQQYKKAA
jgi:hypothetical protein